MIRTGLEKIVSGLIIMIGFIPLVVYTIILKIRISKHILNRMLKFTIAEEGSEREFEMYDRIRNIVGDKMGDGIFMSMKDIDKLIDKEINREIYGIE